MSAELKASYDDGVRAWRRQLLLLPAVDASCKGRQLLPAAACRPTFLCLRPPSPPTSTPLPQVLSVVIPKKSVRRPESKAITVA